MVDVIRVGGETLTVALCVSDGTPARLVAIGSAQEVDGVLADPDRWPVQPLVEVLAVGHGRAHMNGAHHNTAVGRRLRHARHDVVVRDGWARLELVQLDPGTGLEVTSHLRLAERGGAAVQAWTVVRNTGEQRVILQAVSSLATGAFLRAGERFDDVRTTAGRSTWLGEARYEEQPLTAQGGLVDLDLPRHQQQDGRGVVAFSSTGSWSSGTWMPVGLVSHVPTGRAWAWQVEHNGSWTVELAERTTPVGRELTLAAFGPTDEHQWLHPLDPGQEITTVPVSLAVGQAEAGSGLDAAVAALTQHRRALLLDAGRPVRRTPVVFNDYMNTLMGDPTTERLLPLVDAAGSVGAEYFCLDAGWYADGSQWWDAVGEWTPATDRFPNGIDEVLDRVRSHGMVPGLWLEPEVVGVNSPLATTLPADSFLHLAGERVVEHGRYLLDLRSEVVRKHLDSVVDRLVDDHGAGFFKLDYNVTPGPGVDSPGTSAGAGLLDLNRGVLAWLEGLGERHPDVLLESCASGGMRQDFATVSRVNLQSTSDQQDYLRYPPISVNSFVGLLPEQAGIWAYPQPDMTVEEATFCLAGAVLGRMYLSGHLDRMGEAQLDLVREAVTAHRSVLPTIASAVPVWPTGLAGWDDAWLSVGLRDGASTLVTTWRRPGAATTTRLSLPHARGTDLAVEPVFPLDEDRPWSYSWQPEEGVLLVTADGPAPQARVIRLRHG